MTRSMPGISSSGKPRPQSITTISSLYSITVIFLPISPSPPKGMMRILPATAPFLCFFGIVNLKVPFYKMFSDRSSYSKKVVNKHRFEGTFCKKNATKRDLAPDVDHAHPRRSRHSSNSKAYPSYASAIRRIESTVIY